MVMASLAIRAIRIGFVRAFGLGLVGGVAQAPYDERLLASHASVITRDLSLRNNIGNGKPRFTAIMSIYLHLHLGLSCHPSASRWAAHIKADMNEVCLSLVGPGPGE